MAKIIENCKKKIFFALALLAFAESGFCAKAPKKNSPKKKTAAVKASDPYASYPAEMAQRLRKGIQFAGNGTYTDAYTHLLEGCSSTPLRDEFSKKKQNEASLKKIDSSLQRIRKIFAECASLTKSDEASLRKIAEARNEIRKQGEEIAAMSSSGYPFFVSRMILGVREDSVSGMTGILELQFDNFLAEMGRGHKSELEAAMKKIDGESMKRISSAAAELERLQELHGILEINAAKERAKAARIESQKRPYTCLKEISSEETGGKIAAALDLQKNHQKNRNDDFPLDENGEKYTEDLINKAKDFSAAAKSASVIRKNSSLMYLQTISFTEKFADSFIQACAELEASGSSISVGLWVRAATCCEKISLWLEEKDKKSLADLKNQLEADNDGITYPGRSMQNLGKLKESITRDRETINRLNTMLNDGYIYRASFMQQQENMALRVKGIGSLEADFAELEAKAGRLLLEAKISESEVNVYFEKSKQFHEKDNFDRSFENLQKANSLYTRNSDQLKKDGDIKSGSYEKITALRKEIIDKEQPVFVSKMRVIKNKARTEYYAGNFNRASAFISEAESKRASWAKLIDLPLDEDPELKRLKDFINTAIAIKEGREISPYDSKAPEMRQNMQAAQAEYSTATSLFNEGRKTEGKIHFEKAMEKINQIKVFYPRNREAGTMALKIDRIISPASYRETVSAKILSAKQTDFSTRSIQAQETYSSLLDIYELSPETAGLKALIENAEIALGLRPKPKKAVDTAKANRLAQEAKEILNTAGRDDILLSQAKNKAAQSLEIDPTNSLAITVIDEVAMRNGEKSAVILSTKDEELYQNALRDLQGNRIFEAKSKLDRLLAKKDNGRSAKIIKLRKRIEAQL